MYPGYTKYLFQRPKSTVRSTLYTLNTYSWGQNFIHYVVRPAVFEIPSLWKLGNTLNDPRRTLNTYLSTKVLFLHWILTPRGPNFHPFALRPAFFERQGWRKSEMPKMTPEWPWTLNCQKVPCTHLILITEAQISPRFTLWRLLLVFLYAAMVNVKFPETSLLDSWSAVSNCCRCAWSNYVQFWSKCSRNAMAARLPSWITKLKTSKIQIHQSKFDESQGRFEGGEALWNYCSRPIDFSVRETKYREKSYTQKFLNPNQYFCEAQWEKKKSGKVWKNSKASWMWEE